jgi:hypothetical protein
MSDYGIWNSIASSDRDNTKIVLDGKSVQEEFFLNPAFGIQSASKISSNSLLATKFMEFLNEPYLQDELVPQFKVFALCLTGQGRIFGNNVSLFAAPHDPYRITTLIQLLNIPFDTYNCFKSMLTIFSLVA